LTFCVGFLGFFIALSLSPKEEGNVNMNTQQVAMEELRQKLEQLKNVVDRIEKRSSRSSKNFDGSDMKDFYPRHERRERKHHRHRNHVEKLFKRNVRFLKFIDDSNPKVYEEWERKVEQIMHACNFSYGEVSKFVVL